MPVTKTSLVAAELRPGELARIIGVSANTVSRYNPTNAQRITPPAAVEALVYVLGRLPDSIRNELLPDLLAGEHLVG